MGSYVTLFKGDLLVRDCDSIAVKKIFESSEALIPVHRVSGVASNRRK